MKNPTSKQVRTVIDNLTKILPLTKSRKKSLNMYQGAVKDQDHACGTVHCHAGWYAVATVDNEREYITYQDGGRQMAKDLGFNDMTTLICWAKDNPQIWGNHSGYYMFAAKDGKRAFHNATCRPDGAQTVEDIIAHWKEVEQRLIKLEENDR